MKTKSIKPKRATSATPQAAQPKTSNNKSTVEIVTTVAVEISSETVAVRAYYIAQERHRLGLPGDATSDWVEAEQQLQRETP